MAIQNISSLYKLHILFNVLSIPSTYLFIHPTICSTIYSPARTCCSAPTTILCECLSRVSPQLCVCASPAAFYFHHFSHLLRVNLIGCIPSRSLLIGSQSIPQPFSGLALLALEEQLELVPAIARGIQMARVLCQVDLRPPSKECSLPALSIY